MAGAQFVKENPIARGAAYGAALGTLGSLLTSNSSMMGGALAGGLIFGTPGWGRVGALAGSAYGLTLGDGVGSGALGGAALGHAGEVGYRGWLASGMAGVGTGQSLKLATRVAGNQLYREGRAAYEYLGRTGRSAYGAFTAQWSKRRQQVP